MPPLSRLPNLALPALLLVLATGGGSGVAEEPPAKPTAAVEAFDYRHVEPILREKCAGCHAGDRPKSRLTVETLAGLLAGGKRGAPVVAGKPDESLLYLLVSAQRKPFMPPAGEEPLSAAEVEAIRAWIAGGARPGEESAAAAPYSRPVAAPVYARPPPITALAYSTDGERLFVAGRGEVLIHAAEPAAGGEDGTTAGPLARLAGEAERLHALAVSPDGSLLAAAGGSPGLFGELQVWEVAATKLRRFHRIGKDTLFAAAFSPDGSRLLAAGSDRAVHVFEAATGTELHAPEVHSDWVLAAAFTGDGSRIVSAGRDRSIRVLAEPEGVPAGALAAWSEPALTLAPLPGGSVVLAAGEGRTPVLLDARAMKEMKKIEAQPGPVLASAASRDGKQLAVAGAFVEVRVYDAGERKLRFALAGHAEWIYALAFRPDGARLASAGYEGVVRIHELREGKEVRAFVPVPITAASEETAADGR
jgi:WD40 repeat protein